MSEKKKLLKKANMPLGKQAKKKLDKWVNDNINLPMASRGFETAGAAISAALSAGGELMIPDEIADLAMAAVPGGAFLRAGKKGMKVLKKADDAPSSIDYGKIKKAEEDARTQKRKAFDEVAETLEYKPSGEIVRKKPKKKELYVNRTKRED